MFVPLIHLDVAEKDGRIGIAPQPHIMRRTRCDQLAIDAARLAPLAAA